MSKLLIGLSTAAIIAASPALAQTTQEQMKPKPNAEVNRSTDGATAVQPKDVISKQKTYSSDQTVTKSAAVSVEMFRASTLIGAPVKNGADQSIGDINDLMIGADGKVAKVVVGVGGFLGLGERNVVLTMDDINLSFDKNGTLVVGTSMTKAELEALPAWEKKDAK